jgi:hypothetical protein
LEIVGHELALLRIETARVRDLLGERDDREAVDDARLQEPRVGVDGVRSRVTELAFDVVAHQFDDAVEGQHFLGRIVGSQLGSTVGRLERPDGDAHDAHGRSRSR